MNQEEQLYEGWKNRETWCINLRLENDYTRYLYWKAQAAQQCESAAWAEQVRNGVWTIEQATKFRLADQLEREISDAMPSEIGLYGDLLTVALGRVDWEQIAEHWIRYAQEAS